jgi:hypothetical protein
LLLPITIQLLKFWFQSGLHFTRAALACQEINRRKHRCLWTSARQTATLRHAQGGHHRLVSLTRDFSVFIDLSGGRDLVNVLANFYYMHFGCFVKGYQTINRKNPVRDFLYAFSTKGHSLTSKFALFSWNVLAGGLYVFRLSCQGFWETQP